MPSEKPFQATRANAPQSRSFRSEEGGRHGKFNATRHWLTGQVVVLTAEDLDAFDQFTREIAGFAPETAIERQLAHLYATYLWRINRAAVIDHGMFTLGIMGGAANSLNTCDGAAQDAMSCAMTFRNQASEFEKISLYSQSLLHQSEDVLKQLRQVQADRKKQLTDDLSDGTRLYQFYRMQNQTFNPKENGLNLTIDQIEDHVRRGHLQSEAREAEEMGFDADRYTKKTGSASA